MQHINKIIFGALLAPAILALSIITLMPNNASAAKCSLQEKNFIKKSVQSICKSAGETKKTIFILVDGSDPYNKKSIAWIKSNVFNKRVIKPSAQGDELIVAHFHKGALSTMNLTRFCAPKPEDQISYIFDAPGQIKKENNSFYCLAEKIIPDEIFAKPTSAPKSLILEAISEVADNPKLLFSERPGERVFVLVSDLFQNSKNFSFHQICKRSSPSSPVLCPSYKEVLTSTPRAKRYLEGLPVNGKFRPTDKVLIFNVNVKGKLDRSAENFWKGFFVAAGAKPSNITFRFELEQ